MKRIPEIDKKYDFYDNQRKLLDNIYSEMKKSKINPNLSKKLESLFDIIGE